MNEKSSFNLLFKPKTVAIYDTKSKVSFFVEGLIAQGFDRDNLYLISSSEEEVSEITCYRSFEDIPTKKVDLLILSVRRELLVQSLREILDEINVNFVHIFTAGTGEADEIGSKIEKDVKSILELYPGTRAIGPNCMGIYSPDGNISYYPTFPTETGNVGLIFQSGDLHSKFIKFGNKKYNMLFSKGISVGNCVDIQISELLRFYNEDSETDLICVYLEGFSPLHPKEGKKLFYALKKMKKPVLFMRGGITDRGKTAVISHTGSIATKEKIWEAIYQQTPIVKVASSLESMLNYAYLFYKHVNRFKLLGKDVVFPKGKKVLVVLWSGGFGILATDTISKLGLDMPRIEGKKLEKLREIYPPRIGSLENPLDLPWISGKEEYYLISKKATELMDIDLVIVETDAWRELESERFKKYYENLLNIKKFTEATSKTLIIVLHEYPSKSREFFYKKLLEDDFIVFPTVKIAARSFLKLYNYGKKVAKHE